MATLAPAINLTLMGLWLEIACKVIWESRNLGFPKSFPRLTTIRNLHIYHVKQVICEHTIDPYAFYGLFSVREKQVNKLEAAV